MSITGTRTRRLRVHENEHEEGGERPTSWRRNEHGESLEHSARLPGSWRAGNAVCASHERVARPTAGKKRRRTRAAGESTPLALPSSSPRSAPKRSTPDLRLVAQPPHRPPKRAQTRSRVAGDSSPPPPRSSPRNEHRRSGLRTSRPRGRGVVRRPPSPVSFGYADARRGVREGCITPSPSPAPRPHLHAPTRYPTFSHKQRRTYPHEHGEAALVSNLQEVMNERRMREGFQRRGFPARRSGRAGARGAGNRDAVGAVGVERSNEGESVKEAATYAMVEPAARHARDGHLKRVPIPSQHKYRAFNRFNFKLMPSVHLK
ncbi:hypothetical protein B0H17DRAFT_1137111 [Mycena rosella]|uniref:Uncharacterized protein n=1 Tax=Mycena rosella TaxID=1033263 RepID=A0AAD7D911_MYCRO|nr:hypothetical protein B0H17DRAFT_1137111 [Mycena rosella]